MPEEIITGIDIGSTAVRIAVGQRVINDNSEQKLNIIGVAECPSQGISKGVINSIEDAVSSISACLEQAERMTGQQVENVWVGISGSHVISQESKGVIAVSRSTGEISEDDVERAVEAARTVATPLNYEILHVIPKSFTIDGQAGIKDPIGMSGIRLEVDAQIIQGLSSQIKNLTTSIYRTGLDIEDIVLSILASSEVALTPRQKELGVALVNIGGATTSLVVFEEGDVLHTAVLPIGSDHITSDIAIGLRTSIDVAEKVKLEYGSCLPKEISKREEINLAELGGEDILVSQKYIAEIIEARAEEIFEKIDEELKKIDRSGMLPAGAVMIGGGSKLEGVIDLCKKKLRLPAFLGKPQNLFAAIDKSNDTSFITALGLVMWGNQIYNRKGTGRLGKFISRFKSVDEVTNKMRKWFKSLIP